MEISDIPLNLTDKIFQIKFNSDHSIEKIISYFPLTPKERSMLNSISGQDNFSNFHSIFSDTVTDDEWDEVLDVNLKGVFICTQEALPLLKKSDGGSIINIGSVSGQYGGPRTPHYAASKAGLISLSQVIARFVAKDNIRCNTVAAGLIETSMAKDGLKSDIVKKISEGIMMNRLGSSKEVADVVVFLASDQSSYITAQTINVNGGIYF